MLFSKILLINQNRIYVVVFGVRHPASFSTKKMVLDDLVLANGKIVRVDRFTDSFDIA